MTQQEENSWGEWQRHVLIEMEQHRTALKEMNGTIQELKIEVAMLKVKSSLWGAAAGGISVFILFAAEWLRKAVHP